MRPDLRPEVVRDMGFETAVGPADEGRLSRSWRLVKTSWQVMRRDRAMLVLALLGGSFGLLGAAAIFWFSGYAAHPTHPSRGRLALVSLIAAWPLTFVSVYFNVAIAAAAHAALRGERLTLREALAVSRARIGQIAAWSLLAAGVGQLLSEIAERVPFGGRLASWALGGAWSVLMIFAVPVLALEGRGAPGCVRRSARLIRDRWGEGIAGRLGIGVVFGVASIVPVTLICSGLGMLHAATGIGIALIVAGLATLLPLMALSGALEQVFAVALYRYATSGSASAGFREDDLQRPFVRRGLWGR